MNRLETSDTTEIRPAGVPADLKRVVDAAVMEQLSEYKAKFRVAAAVVSVVIPIVAGLLVLARQEIVSWAYPPERIVNDGLGLMAHKPWAGAFDATLNSLQNHVYSGYSTVMKFSDKSPEEKNLVFYATSDQRPEVTVKVQAANPAFRYKLELDNNPVGSPPYELDASTAVEAQRLVLDTDVHEGELGGNLHLLQVIPLVRSAGTLAIISCVVVVRNEDNAANAVE